MTLQSVIDEKVEVAKQQGRQEGRLEGRLEGKNQERASFVVAMYKKGIELSEIASIANISIDKVKKIIASKNKTA